MGQHSRTTRAATEVARTALREAVLAALRVHPITLIVAPPVSGKATLVRQVRARMAELDDFPSVQIIENFGRLAPERQAQVAQDIEAAVMAGQRWLVTSDRCLDAFFAINRMRGEVGQFGMHDLALADAEVREFLGADLAGQIPERFLRALNERAGGWAGAWMVVRTLLRQGHAPADLARSFSGRDRDLAAYFGQQVMPNLAPGVGDLLRDIAPLHEVSEDVVRAATGRADGGPLLRAAVRDCGFVLDIDRNGDRQRLHPLFRDYLNGLARQGDAERHHALTARFAEVAGARGEWLEAARLFSESGHAGKAIEILRRFADDLITGRGEVASFRQLIASLPKDAAQMSSLAAELALGSIFAGDFAGAAALVDQAYSAPQLGEDERVRLEAIGISVNFGLERFHSVRTEAPRWLERHPLVDPRYRAVAAIALFWSCTAERDSSGAYRALGIARTDVAKARAPFLDGWLSIIAAAHKFAYGQVGGAAQVLDAAHATGMIRHTMDLVRAALAYELGQTDRAQQLIRSSLRAGVRHSVVETSLYGWGTAARLAARDAEFSAVLQVLQEAEALMASRHGERARRLVRLLRAALILQAPGEALLPSLEIELDAVCNDAVAQQLCPSYVETARLALARYHARCGDPRRAISLVQPIQSAALRVNRIACWGEASLIYAGALARRGDTNRAMRQAWSAIATMADAGYLSSIADEHMLLAPLLDALVARAHDTADTHSAATVAAISELGRRAGRRQPAIDLPSMERDAPIDPVALTDTERRVLALAAQGLANADIAARMTIGVTTVKWHLKNIFAKLSVRSRTAAFVQARRLGMDL
ncbi:LuxR C-terminal-related transcriptional regulator [Novosphingobium sp. KCTC 2891]|uniref:helix-turn-helix transcriptional regulator n=1 Tax=Novosphingobium sp. KCTC 2891 TaxID=2989730 RepID=UPI002222D819|nr:LuxR C-terminal-related transcriptional regulator [Novosphingobium sp. KCTC 2891]MCW1381496.1 LuxR C-terminal-related transcriptional regulator [Novosphingobium sp. KCTC 2891]